MLSRCISLTGVRLRVDGHPNLIRTGFLLDVLTESILKIPQTHARIKSLRLEVSSIRFYRNENNFEEFAKVILPKFASQLESLRLDFVDRLTTQAMQNLCAAFESENQLQTLKVSYRLGVDPAAI